MTPLNSRERRYGQLAARKIEALCSLNAALHETKYRDPGLSGILSIGKENAVIFVKHSNMPPKEPCFLGLTDT